MCMYVRLVGSLAQNLFRRVGDDLADCAVFTKRSCVYKLRCLRRSFDDVGPDEGDGEAYVALPEHQAQLVSGLERFPWFGHMDRKTAQIYVHRGGQGCFIVRPSSSTRSLTLTLWHENRTYNILVRRRDDGLIALGSKKHNEVAFRTIEEMCKHYSQNELILYSGGELAGKTLLKFPSQVISQQPSSSQSTSCGINRHTLALDRLENRPRTLEESVHQSAQRSMSLKTFRETKTNNQVHRNNSSSGNPVVDNVHHKSYENVMLHHRQNFSLRHSMDTLIPNKLQFTDLMHPSYENISHNSTTTTSVHTSQASLTSTGLIPNRHDNYLNEIGKENTENKRLASRITDEETKRKRTKSSDSASSTSTQISDGNFQTQNLHNNTEQNNSVFKSSAVKRTEKLLAPSEAEEDIVERFKFSEKEKIVSSFLHNNVGQTKNPLLSSKVAQKSQSFEISNEQNSLAKRQFDSEEGQCSSSLTSLELNECEINQPEISKTQSIEPPILANYSIDTNIKSSLASTEFVSKVVKKDDKECQTVSSDNTEQPIKHSVTTKGLVQRTMENFTSKNSIKQPNVPLKNGADFQSDIYSPLIITTLVHKPSKNISSQDSTETAELKHLTNASNTSVAKLKENFLVSIPPSVQKSIKTAACEENVDPISKSKVLIKELQTHLQTNDLDSNIPSAERKLNLLNSQKTINKKQVFESNLNTIFTVNQEPNHKPSKNTASKAKLAASFFEELAKTTPNIAEIGSYFYYNC